ncbi:MAG: hypothetical protein KDA93_26495 [Planctomycetaceae bacterium]|nr:hypothetical protein [Planctomycetaceae bacterium]
MAVNQGFESVSDCETPHVRRRQQIYVGLAILAVATLAIPIAFVAMRLSEADHLQRLATGRGAVVQWGWRHHDKWFDSMTMRRIGGNAHIGFHENPTTGTPFTDVEWLALSDELQPLSHRVHGVDFSKSNVGRQSLLDLSRYPGLLTLCLASTNLTDEGIEVLDDLPQIEFLMVYENNMTDEAMRHIAHLPQLKYLLVDGTQMTSKAINELKALTHLEELRIHGTPLDGDALKSFADENPNIRIIEH